MALDNFLGAQRRTSILCHTPRRARNLSRRIVNGDAWCSCCGPWKFPLPPHARACAPRMRYAGRDDARRAEGQVTQCRRLGKRCPRRAVGRRPSIHLNLRMDFLYLEYNYYHLWQAYPDGTTIFGRSWPPTASTARLPAIWWLQSAIRAGAGVLA